jgi:hypothetical protein
MSMSTHVVRNKPAWLSLYGFYLCGALLVCGLAIVRFASEHGAFAAGWIIPNASVFGFALYSLLHWQVHWARRLNVGLNATMAILGLLYMTPIAGKLPWFIHTIFGFIVIPVIAGMPAESLQSMSPTSVSVIGLALISIAVYWVVCWLKFVPAADGSVADLESEELSRNVRSVVRKGIIALWVIGILALFKAVLGFDDGNSEVWSLIAGASLALAVVAMLLTRLFPGEESAAARPSEVNPLADDDLDLAERHHPETMRKKAKRQETNVFKTDVTGIAFALIGIPILLVIVFVAMMLTIMNGGGFGTFLVIFLIVGIGAFFGK